MDISKTKMADLGTMMGGSPSSDAGPELAAGKVIGDRYEIIGVIGRGGMGVVYEARDTLRQSVVALKFLRPELVSNDTAIQRFLNEARIVSDLSHPNIVRVYDVARHENTYFLSMERLQGQSLRQTLDDLKARNEPMPVARAVSILKDLTQALAYAHRSTIHRDLKPENIWLQPDGSVKLMDFGIARLQSQTQGLTKVASALGTAYYMAPEQLVGNSAVDQRADQYSLGVVFYEMLTGSLPLGRSQPASTARPGLNRKFDLVVDQLLGGKPESRYPDDATLLTALDALPVTEKRVRAPNPKLPKQIAAASAALALLGAAGYGVTQWQQGREQARIAAEVAAAEQARLDAAAKAKAKATADTAAADANRVAAAAKAKADAAAADANQVAAAAKAKADAGAKAAERAKAAEAAVAEAEAKRKAEAANVQPIRPQMVQITGGTFRMGDLSGKGASDEKPVHSVTVKPFLLGRYEVTVAEWDRCVNAGGCNYNLHNIRGGSEKRPVSGLSFVDVQEYIKWLNEKNGERYRLPTEAEWEYAARAGTETEYSFGNSITSSQARFNSKEVEVGSYAANAWGLHDMHGNVWEWVQDCYHDTYNGAPENGSAWTSSGCDRRIIRSGGWTSGPEGVRSAERAWDNPAYRSYNGVGFRLAKTE